MVLIVAFGSRESYNDDIKEVWILFYEGCTVEEIEAYRDLESATFDFGEGSMKIEGWYGSEDAYYEMDIQNHYENQLNNYTSNNFTSEEDINFNRLWIGKNI